MNLRSLAGRNLLHYRTLNATAVIGLAIAGMVIVGSLVIGDSVRGSLRETALSRLGSITHGVFNTGFFRAQLVEDIYKSRQMADKASNAAAILNIPAVVQDPENSRIQRATALGVTTDFWGFYQDINAQLDAGECAVNENLAQQLGLKTGDPLLLTVERPGSAAPGTLFSKRNLSDVAPSLSLTVAQILKDSKAADFRLDVQSQKPQNVFLNREELAELLQRPGLANAGLFAAKPDDKAVSQAIETAMSESLELADFGLYTENANLPGYMVLKSSEVVFKKQVLDTAMQVAAKSQAWLTSTSVYLASRIALADKGPEAKGLAYCMVAGAVPSLELGTGSNLRDGEIILNDWAAQDLGAKVGDMLAVDTLAPMPDGEYVTVTTSLKLVKIIPVAKMPDDSAIIPNVSGISDARTFNDWDVPFPLDLNLVTPRDDKYWELYKARPKGIVSHNTVRRMWQQGTDGKDTDWLTGLWFRTGQGDTITSQKNVIKDLCEALGKTDLRPGVRPLHEQAIAASKGTSDFSQLFLGLGMFIIVAGLALTGMLLALGIEQRSVQAGLMQACGLEARDVARVLWFEGALLAVVGALLGVALGVPYAGEMLAALGKWWAGALGQTQGVTLHLEPVSLLTGGLIMLVIGFATTWHCTRNLVRRETLELLRGQQLKASRLHSLHGIWLGLTGLGLFLGLALKSFMLAGGMLLVLFLLGGRWLLAAIVKQEKPGDSLFALALRNMSLKAGRSLLVFGLLAVATFTVVIVAVNSRDLKRTDVYDKNSGTGGFNLLAKTQVALPVSLVTPAGRAKLNFDAEAEKALAACEIFEFKMSPGEDISCLNIARPASPRVLGVSDSLLKRGGFRLVGKTDWNKLNETVQNNIIPAFGDADSVQWSLHSAMGKTYSFEKTDGKPVQVRFDGLIKGSVFAGELLVSQENFKKLYPQVNGPSVFLIRTTPEAEAQVKKLLEEKLGDTGLQARSTREILAEFSSVQNAYLMMFLALGGLGLLLGTVGLAVVVLRNVYERRAELALMSAMGFELKRLRALLLWEHAGLMITGLLAGTICALVAMLPQITGAEADVNWLALGGALGTVLFVGLMACIFSVQIALQGTTLSALRSE